MKLRSPLLRRKAGNLCFCRMDNIVRVPQAMVGDGSNTSDTIKRMEDQTGYAPIGSCWISIGFFLDTHLLLCTEARRRGQSGPLLLAQ